MAICLRGSFCSIGLWCVNRGRDAARASPTGLRSPVVGPSAGPDRDGQGLFVVPDRCVDVLGVEAESDKPIHQLA